MPWFQPPLHADRSVERQAVAARVRERPMSPALLLGGLGALSWGAGALLSARSSRAPWRRSGRLDSHMAAARAPEPVGRAVRGGRRHARRDGIRALRRGRPARSRRLLRRGAAVRRRRVARCRRVPPRAMTGSQIAGVAVLVVGAGVVAATG